MTRARELREAAWSNSPILLPLAFERREWNAVYIAFYLAEYSGAPVEICHVETAEDVDTKVAEFRRDLETFGRQLGVRFGIKPVRLEAERPSVREIAAAIAQASGSVAAQAIVMSAHREPFFTEMFGRVSDRTARLARCRVVLVETPYPGLGIPAKPSHILVPVLPGSYHSDPFVVAAALTSSASVANAEIQAVRVVPLPPTVPLDAIDTSETLRGEEHEFSAQVARQISSLGRLFTPRLLAVRDLGREVSEYAREIGADLMVLYSAKPRGRFERLVTKDEYELVRHAPCIVLVTIPASAG